MLTVALYEIFKFLSATAASRNIVEGEQLVNSKLITMCGTTELTENTAKIYEVILKTSGIMSDPRLITGEIELLNNEVNIKFMNCNCPTGTSYSCKHIAAIFFYLNRNDIRQLELMSSTDVKCLWKQQKGPSTEKFKPLPWGTFCCFKQTNQHNFSD
ncbi:hypothetical protein PV328_001236 [Microctonus aethiopoides]|uniref:SWIM-type domain-containing protein n=1 Tax=Microctonus aethiopoides TaxID=144406 RepID=A0AA39FWI1_9HYME|nr:hypothetical protein PV328_001236 [Microctonus aethiopoides]